MSQPAFAIEPLDVPQDRRMQSLVAVAGAVAGAHELEPVLEIAAEETRAILGVSSLSISRWDAEAGRLRTLINVGELAECEERWPADETYALAELPRAYEVLVRGEPHLMAVADDMGEETAERKLLIRLGKDSFAAVPIIHDGETWGEMFAANGSERMPLRSVDVQFMQAICTQVALAIGRAELYSQLLAAAYCDSLTGLANRRAFDERLAEAFAGPVAVLLGDIDGLKLLNDTAGHAAGDDALRAVGRALAEREGPDAFPARIGGDEFCLILEGASAAEGQRVADELTRSLSAAEPPVQVSWGVAVHEHGGTNELLRAADRAQYAAKRRRGWRARRLPTGRRLAHAPDSVAALLAEGVALLDAAGDDPAHLRAALKALREASPPPAS